MDFKLSSNFVTEMWTIILIELNREKALKKRAEANGNQSRYNKEKLHRQRGESE